ncbi:MAG TPA: NAD/NADP octopine/nopaline dehydrogenase family protein [Burkholderiaceae bacterium]|nr:NAD/NADP octopine/nopaline dehydrogenase family protein [Burkholderiaceae bacterium]
MNEAAPTGARPRAGIVGVGAIGLASAGWLAARGHSVTLWPPRGPFPHPLSREPLEVRGVLEGRFDVEVANDVRALCAAADLVLVAVPANGHRLVIEALVEHLDERHEVIVSSMASLSSLVLREALQARGRDVTVGAFGTTAVTARRESPTQVRVMTQRATLGVSALPAARTERMRARCAVLFGNEFVAHANALATALTNINPVAHGPLALLNWTRIERAEAWPQYHYMTPRVAGVIERLDAERLALAQAFGLPVRTIERHFAQSFGTTAERLADIAAELHAKRGGPPGPVDIHTRFLAEDVPFGLVFLAALGRLAAVPTPATDAIIATAGLVLGRDLAGENDLLPALALERSTASALLVRVS